MAADLDVMQPTPMPEASPFGPRWDGLSIGVNGGVLWGPGQSASQVWYPETITPAGIPNSFSLSSFGGMGGAQAGFSKQWSSFVFGASADYDFVGGSKASKSGSGTYLGVGYNYAESQQLNSLGTIRARIGVTPIDNALIYATGGLAWGQTQVSSALNFNTGASYAGSHTDYTVGWAAGAGVEYALDPQWSVNLEFLYYDLGASHVTGAPNYIVAAGFAQPESDTAFAFRGYTLRLGLNYLLDAPNATSLASPASDPTSEILGEIGVRAGLSTSSMRMKLSGLNTSVQASELTYKDSTAETAEFFGRIDHPSSGIFAKGYAGIGRENGGNLQDQDFPPGVTPYSSTNSSLSDGRVGYASIDAGYYALTSAWYKLGGFVGYHYLDERYNAFGCTQTAGNPGICAPGPTAVSAANMASTYEGQWNSVRLGLAAQLAVAAGITVRAEGAWLPYMSFTGGDDHWLREPVDFSGTIPESGSGSNGYQLEGEIDYALSHDFTIGVGGRYWSMNAKGNVAFQNVTPNGGPQGASFFTQRAQVFVQTAYRF
jgi:opacity protein-like surface antigen